MFGFLQPARGDTAYRQIYARGCQSLRDFAGLSALPMLSFEAVFLQTLATDVGWCDAPTADAPTCCRLRRQRAAASAMTVEFERFSAAFGLLLVSIKLEDDIHDEGSWKARFMRWKLRSALSAARQFFSQLDPDFDDRIAAFLREHAALEQSRVRPTWHQYRLPTSNAFAYVFGLAGRLGNVSDAEGRCEWLSRIGAEVGSAIISFDCAADWESDRRRGLFNPLTDAQDVTEMLQQAELHLARAAWIAEERVAVESISLRVLLAAYRRVSWQGSTSRRRSTWLRLAEQWGLRRQAGYAHAKCDCFCEGCCAGLECLGGAADGAICAADGCAAAQSCGGGSCCCDACCCDACFVCMPNACVTEERRNASSKKNTNTSTDGSQTTEARSEFSHLIGLRGRVRSTLNPTGVVEINGRHYPAQSEAGTIDEDEFVEVVAARTIGVVVRPE